MFWPTQRRRSPSWTFTGRRARLWVEELEPRTLLSATARIIPSVAVLPDAVTTSPYGLTPGQVRHAYGFDGITFANGGVTADGQGQTIAIVDAYDDPGIRHDLHVFDQAFGLADPPSFTKALVPGTPANTGWSEEIALDVEWAHAIAPKANLLLVEAPSSSTGDLLSAVDYARHQSGVVAVSMSWGGSEFFGETSYDGYFSTPSGHIGGSGLPGGVTFVASSGDSGAWYGAEWPAVSPNVLAVAGTRLRTDAQGNYLGETAWSGSGGGFSNWENEPGFQGKVQGTGARTSPDVAYNADPNSGVAVYDSIGAGGWFQVGGTSAGAPQWAALLALADQGRALDGRGSLANAQSAVYNLPAGDFHDITAGSNGYRAGTGYDLVTGLGSPIAPKVVGDLAAGIGAAAVKAAGTSSHARVGTLHHTFVVATTGRPPSPNAATPPAPATALIAEELARELLPSARLPLQVVSGAVGPAITPAPIILAVPTPSSIVTRSFARGMGNELAAPEESQGPLDSIPDDGLPPQASPEEYPSTTPALPRDGMSVGPLDAALAPQAFEGCFTGDVAGAYGLNSTAPEPAAILGDAASSPEVLAGMAALAVVLSGSWARRRDQQLEQERPRDL